MTRFSERRYSAQHAMALQTQGFPPSLARALASRNIRSASELDMSLARLAPPETLPGTAQAAAILADAIDARRRVFVIGDYDCDGATATAIAIRAMRSMGADVHYIIPDRETDGYGLSNRLVDVAAEAGAGVLVTVDNGISALAAIERAKALGMRVVVTDHHLQGDELPAADVIVNPALRGSPFKSPALAGCGVILYVMLALRREFARRHPDWRLPNFGRLLDLVAVGTVADVVPLDENNRILVAEGLKRIRAGKMQPGLAALWAHSRYDPGNATTDTIGFRIAPRINAAGRLTSMQTGVECLIADDQETARQLADALDSTNSERKTLEFDGAAQARRQAEELHVENRFSVVVRSADWHPGIVGLLASDLVRAYKRPTFAFTRNPDGTWRGSGRSIAALHLRDALADVHAAAPGLILKFGGHAGAAGLTIGADGFDEFSRRFDAAARERLGGALPDDVVLTDGALAPDELTPELAAEIERLPWGNMFPEPLWSNRFRVVHQSIVSSGTLRATLELGGERFTGLWFKHNALFTEGAVTLAYRARVDRYRGNFGVQLNIEAQATG